MKSITSIESTQNPRIKAALKLRKNSVRKERKKTLVEGFREIQRATESGWIFDELYFCSELFIHSESEKFLQKLQETDLPLFHCSEAAFRKISYRDTPDGFIALSPLVGKKLDDIILPKNPLILIAENIEKPGNLGAILRTADATGVDVVIVCGNKTDINNPNVIRASIGTLFFLPVVEATALETIEWLKIKQIKSIATFPDASTLYTDVNLKNNGVAIVVGAEDSGLQSIWNQQSTHKVSIPMLGKNDSLNVATAAAILLYETIRQQNKL